MSKSDRGKKNTAQAAAQSRGSGSMGNTYLLSIIAMVVLGLVVFATPAFVVFEIGVIPSIVAAIIDREPGRNATIAVTATNFAGVAPFFIDLLISGATMARAMAMMREQRRLIEEWGEGVTEMPPPRKSAATSAKPA